MSGILWLASYPKSGNTWLRAFLHNLVHDRGGPLDLGALPKTSLMDAFAAHYLPFIDRPHTDLGSAEVARLRPRVQRAMAASHPGTVLVKTHSMLAMLSGTPSHDPQLTVGAVYIVRDPRDVALSYADHLGLGLDRTIAAMARVDATTAASATGVTEFIGSWSQNVESWTREGSGRVLVLRYEDMLAAPRATFGRVVDFLRLDASRAMVKKAVANTSFEKLAGQEARAGFSERSPLQKRFFRSGRSGAWRAILSEEQARRIAADHGAVMRRFGYLDDEGS